MGWVIQIVNSAGLYCLGPPPGKDSFVRNGVSHCPIQIASPSDLNVLRCLQSQQSILARAWRIDDDDDDDDGKKL